MSSEWKKQVDEELDKIKQERSISTPLSNFDAIVNTRYLSSVINPIQTDVGNLQTDVGNLQTDVGNLQTDVGVLKQVNFYNGALIIPIEFVSNLFLTSGSLYFQQRLIPIPTNVFSVWVMEDDYTLTSALDKKVVPTITKVTTGNWGLMYKVIFGSPYAQNNKILIMQPPKYTIANVLSGSFTIANQAIGTWAGYRYSSTAPIETTISGLSLDTDVFNVYYGWGGVEFLHGGWGFYESASGSAVAGIMYMIKNGTTIRIVVKASGYYSPMSYWILRAVLPTPSINKTISISYARNTNIFVTELGSTLPKYVDIMLGNSTQNLYAPETITAYYNLSSLSTTGSEPPDGWGFIWKKIIKYNTSTGKWEVWVYLGQNAETTNNLFNGAYPNVVKVRAWY